MAIIIQAILFGLSHGYNTIGLLEVIGIDLICGFLTWKTNGIEIGSTIHTANNFSLGLFIMLGLQSSSATPQTYSVLSTFVFEIILFIIMYYVGRKTNWFGEIPETIKTSDLLTINPFFFLSKPGVRQNSFFSQKYIFQPIPN